MQTRPLAMIAAAFVAAAAATLSAAPASAAPTSGAPAKSLLLSSATIHRITGTHTALKSVSAESTTAFLDPSDYTGSDAGCTGALAKPRLATVTGVAIRAPKNLTTGVEIIRSSSSGASLLKAARSAFRACRGETLNTIRVAKVVSHGSWIELLATQGSTASSWFSYRSSGPYVVGGTAHARGTAAALARAQQKRVAGR